MTDSEQIQSNELLPTPPLPENLPRVNLSENAHQVISRRYRRKGENGSLIETVEEMFWRVAYHVAKVETVNPISVDARAQDFYHLLAEKSSFLIRLPLPEQAPHSGSWQRVLFCRSPMTWEGRKTASFPHCEMLP